MRNKRTLKKRINLICEELFTECVAASLYAGETNHEDAGALFFSIVKMQKDFTARISHQEKGLPASTYFRDVREKFAAQVSDILDQINNIQ